MVILLHNTTICKALMFCNNMYFHQPVHKIKICMIIYIVKCNISIYCVIKWCFNNFNNWACVLFKCSPEDGVFSTPKHVGTLVEFSIHFNFVY